MALSKELITAQPALKDLSEEAVQRIVELSVNDENNVIGERIGRVYGDLDKDIAETFKVEKRPGEKTYDYLKRVGRESSERLTTLNEQAGKVDAVKAERDRLEAQLKDGKGDEALKQKLRDAEQKIENLNKKYQTEKKEWETKQQELSNRVSQIQITTEFDRASAGLQLKPEFDEQTKQGLVELARHRILQKYKPDFKENEQGKTQMVFRKPDGELLLNQEKGLNPMQAADLLTKELQPYLGKSQEGGGSKPPKGKKTIDLPDVSSAKTQVEADEIIMSTLMQRGLTRGSKAFTEERDAIRKEAKVSDLPIQ